MGASNPIFAAVIASAIVKKYTVENSLERLKILANGLPPGDEQGPVETAIAKKEKEIERDALSSSLRMLNVRWQTQRTQPQDRAVLQAISDTSEAFAMKTKQIDQLSTRPLDELQKLLTRLPKILKQVKKKPIHLKNLLT